MHLRDFYDRLFVVPVRFIQSPSEGGGGFIQSPSEEGGGRVGRVTRETFEDVGNGLPRDINGQHYLLRKIRNVFAE